MPHTCASTRRSHPLWFGLLRPALYRLQRIELSVDWFAPRPQPPTWPYGPSTFSFLRMDSQNGGTWATKKPKFPLLLFVTVDDTDVGRPPLLAAYSESLTPTNPFKDVGLGRSPYQRTGQAIRYLQLPQPRSTSSHSPLPSGSLFYVCPPIFTEGSRVCPLTIRAEAGLALHVAFGCIELRSPLPTNPGQTPSSFFLLGAESQRKIRHFGSATPFQIRRLQVFFQGKSFLSWFRKT